ncbi:hypothetical protein DFH29DRAFT_884786 [Suillus ampliporus]|nr:hypothetical protein DFH29DRAFT_884786 [Suillus ampliporus]
MDYPVQRAVEETQQGRNEVIKSKPLGESKQIKTKRGKRTKDNGATHRDNSSSNEASDSSTSTESESDSPSTPSSDSSPHESDALSTSSYGTPPARKKRSSKERKLSRTRKSSRKKNTLKPIPPAEYDGTVDSRAFHRFIIERTAYGEDGNVPRK